MRKSQLKRNHLNKPVYRSKGGKKKNQPILRDDKHKEQQKAKHEDVKKDSRIIKYWGSKVRKSRPFFLECV